MSDSFEVIDYRIRPGKSMERKMLCEAFRRLAPFGSVSGYKYVGFGSVYFSDFSLFHRALGINSMFSIERADAKQERFDFNLPFSCVTMMYGESTDELPKLAWDSRAIVWLDYDDPLRAGCLADVGVVAGKAQPGSVFVLSVNARPVQGDGEGGGTPEGRLKELRDRVGQDKVPLEVKGEDLLGWGTSKVSQRIVRNEIERVLEARNATRERGSHLQFRQLFFFEYDDGAKMMTTGGIFIDEGQGAQYAQCEFEKLAFIRTAKEPHSIQSPKLTFREMRYLDKLLPGAAGKQLSLAGVPQRDVDAYTRCYRYFPAFTEADV